MKVPSISAEKSAIFMTGVLFAGIGAAMYRFACKKYLQAMQVAQAESDLDASPKQIERMLDVIEKEILPKTKTEVSKGNKVFGAAVLDQHFETVHADTNHETLSPLYHGEIYCIKVWSETLPKEEQTPATNIFLSTHEPCCMCVSAIVWSGFKKCYYFFPYETTRDQGIPHDINIMHQLWAVNSYQKSNDFLETACIFDLIDAIEDKATRDRLKSRADAISKIYENLSTKYHTEKADNPDNILAFN